MVNKYMKELIAVQKMREQLEKYEAKLKEAIKEAASANNN